MIDGLFISVAKKKRVNKTGQRLLTELTTDATNVIMHFCHIERRFTVKH